MIQEDIARIGLELKEMTERGERRDAERAERESVDTEDWEGKEDELKRESEMREKEWQEWERLAYLRLEREREEENQRLEITRIEGEARKAALEKMERELEIDRLALERLKLQRYKEEKEKEERRRKDREWLEMLRWEEERYRTQKPFGISPAASLRSGTPQNPFMAPNAGGFFLDGLNLQLGNLHMDNIDGGAGFYNYNGGVIDQNSGNKTTYITTNSNNDSAIRIGPGKYIFCTSFLLASMLI